MSSFGPTLLVDGPLPRPPKYGLLTVAQELPDAIEADGGVGQRWGNGVVLYPYPPALPEGFDPCSEGTFRVKDDGARIDLQDFNAFTAYLPIQCTAGGIRDDDAFRSRALAALEATIGYAAERQFVGGDTMPLNPFVTDSELDTYATGGLEAHRALAVLERAISLTGHAGVIHLPPDFASLVADVLIDVGGVLRTVGNGTPVAVGHGYVGAQPSGWSADPINDDTVYGFATGPVVFKLGEAHVNPPTIREALDRTSNDVVYRAERDVLVAWDAQLQFAVQANIAL